MLTHKKIGLVLSGGGYRAAAHCGALKAMHELGLKADVVSGASAGAIVGALYSSGYSWEDIYKFLKKTEVLKLKNYTFQKAGILDSEKYINLLQDIFPDNSFEALKTPLYVATTDLKEAKTKFFYTGELIRPLIASCAVPGVFTPVTYGNTLLCDGGVTDNLPTEPLVPITDVIIGVYVNPLQDISPNDIKNTRSVMQRAFLVIRETQSRQHFNNCDVLISPKTLYSFNVLSKQNLDQIFEMGYVDAMEKLPAFIQDLED